MLSVGCRSPCSNNISLPLRNSYIVTRVREPLRNLANIWYYMQHSMNAALGVRQALYATHNTLACIRLANNLIVNRTFSRYHRLSFIFAALFITSISVTAIRSLLDIERYRETTCDLQNDRVLRYFPLFLFNVLHAHASDQTSSCYLIVVEWTSIPGRSSRTVTLCQLVVQGPAFVRISLHRLIFRFARTRGKFVFVFTTFTAPFPVR